MASRALPIGAQTYGLTGVANDLLAIREVLAGFGFDDLRTCEGTCATRAGILGAYEALIVAGDRAFVYYSGHGGYTRESSGVATIDRQYIVPTDFDREGKGDFRGIAAVELSVLLGRLTECTDNAVVVLDCCHSAMMSRDLGDFGRAAELPYFLGRTPRARGAAHRRRAADRTHSDARARQGGATGGLCLRPTRLRVPAHDARYGRRVADRGPRGSRREKSRSGAVSQKMTGDLGFRRVRQ